MEPWQAAAAANLLSAAAYFAISGLVLRGLQQTRQLTRNALALCTAAIFLTCGGHHLLHGLMLAGVTGHHVGQDGLTATEALRTHLDWGITAWDLTAAAAAVAYLSLRRGLGRLLEGPAMFGDRVTEESRRRALAAIDRIAEAVSMYGPDGVVEHVNPAAERILEDLADRHGGRSIDDVGWAAIDRHGVPIPADALPVERTRTTGEAVDGEELGFPGTDGDVRWLRISTRPSDDRAEGPWPVIATFTDVTARVAAERALAASDALHRSVLGQLPDTLVTVYAGDDLRVRLMEGEQLRRGEVDYEAMRGKTLAEAVPPGVAAVVEPLVRRAMAGEPGQLAFRGEGSGVHWEVSVTPWRDPGGQDGALLVSRDVTASKALEAQTALAQRRFADAFDHAPSGMALCDEDGRVLQANASTERLFGRVAGGLDGALLSTLLHPDDQSRFVRAVREAHDEAVTLEARVLHADGHPRWVALTVCTLDEGDAAALLVQAQDITERRDYERRLEHLADHDPLTGLFNRRAFERHLGEHLARAQRYGGGGAVLMLDLDHFKTINDTLGHAAGDRLIVATAGALKARLRETDVLARLGGDEFAVLLPTGDHAETATVCAALCEAVRSSVTVSVDGSTARVTASVGACVVDGQATADEVLVDADLAMYDAKEAGRDGYALSSGDGFDQPKLKARMAWVDRIRHAIEEDRFVLYAQPIVGLADRVPVGHELLLRMVGDDGDHVPPGTFLYVAERFGLATEIDRWVVDRAVDLLATRPGLQLSVNVSGHSVGSHALLDQLDRRVAQTGVDPTRLMFEITETAAVANIPQARDFAERLQSIGCRLALDDFGAGFGGFYYLKHLPFDVLKLDGEFVKGCLRNQTDQLVIDAVVALARGLGRTTVAEFVEDEATAVELLRRGVDLGQGFHFARPAPFAAEPAVRRA